MDAPQHRTIRRKSVAMRAAESLETEMLETELPGTQAAGRSASVIRFGLGSEASRFTMTGYGADCLRRRLPSTGGIADMSMNSLMSSFGGMSRISSSSTFVVSTL